MYKNIIQRFLSNDAKDTHIHKLETLVEQLHREIYSLKDENQLLLINKSISKDSHRKIPVAGFDSTDCEPTDSNERKGYISEVDHFFESVLKDKLKVSIAEIREALALLSGNTAAELRLTREQYDFFMRGMEAGMWKIHDWCVTLQGERREALQDQENNK